MDGKHGKPMNKIKNVLFIMCDQLRADYLGCYGHPTIKTPNIDALAAQGVKFTRAYCAAPTCGPSRMSFYTGRSMFSHGAIWNFVPLSIREQTIGDFLRPHGVRVALAGKTHFAADMEAIRRLGIPAADGSAMLEGGFEVVDRYEGHADPGGDHPYMRFLRNAGYGGPNPWDEFVMSASDAAGRRVSGWQMRNVHLPARVREQHSETAYTTDVAIDYIRRQDDQPWFLHLSYIKPHWPYLAPAPYHDLYGVDDCIPTVKSEAELINPHPVYAAYLKHRESVNFARDEVAARVKIPYMGLISQIDHHLGRLMATLRETGQDRNTLIVFTSDHGDYLGDHWLGDKDLFHEPSVRIPMIVVDPHDDASASRGSASDALVESIDVLPTVMDALGLGQPNHLLEGDSLLGHTRGRNPGWRDAAISEIDYAYREARVELGQDPRRCRGYMVRTESWKYIYWDGHAEQLFDMTRDPDELRDVAGDEGLSRVLSEHKERLFEWMRTRKLSVTVPDESIMVSRHTIEPRHGIEIGVW